jgi:hypothetical protein
LGWKFDFSEGVRPVRRSNAPARTLFLFGWRNRRVEQRRA